MKKSVNVYQMVTDKVMEQLAKGVCPWHQPWVGCGTDDCAINYVSRKPYSMLNQMLLGRSGEWLSFKQVQDAGGRIKKGAKAGIVVFYTKRVYKTVKEVVDGDEKEHEEVEEKLIPVLKYYNVFHIDDCEGIESKLGHETVNSTLKPIERAENVINGYVTREKSLTFQNSVPSSKAYYRPSQDKVVVPMLSQYKITEEYYSTTFHELTHSTMHPERCNRKEATGVAAFGGENYSREELVAELGSVMLCKSCGLDSDKAFNNSVAYLKGWLKALKDDNKMIIWASSRAEKAARYIMGEK